jgi:hypothetical protein
MTITRTTTANRRAARSRNFMPVTAALLAAAWSAFAAPAGAAEVNILPAKQVNACIDEVTKAFNKMDPKADAVLLVAAKHSCVVTGDATSSKLYFHSMGDKSLKNSVDKAGITIGQGFSGTEREPGLLNLNGATNVLRDMLTKEAEALWAESSKRGGIPGTAQSGSGQSTSPTDSTGTSPTIVMTAEEGSSQGAVRAPGNYAQVYIDWLARYPGEGQLLKLRMYAKLKDIALATRTLSKDEKDFMGAMERYIQGQRIKVAEGAWQQYQDWLAKKGTTGENKSLVNVYWAGASPPPDFIGAAEAAVILGAYSAAFAALAAGVSANALPVFAAVIPSVAHASYAGALTGVTAASSASSIVGAAAGPLAIVLGAATVAILQAINVAEGEKMVRKLRDARTDAKKAVSLKDLLNSRDGDRIVLHYFAKATGVSSPTGWTSPAEGCRVCLYEKANYQGQSVCTQGRIPLLEKASIGGAIVNFNNKPASVALENAKCEMGHAVLYENPRFDQRQRLIVKHHIKDLSKLRRGNKATWVKAVSSVEFKNEAAVQCEVCLFSERNYKGQYVCIQDNDPSLGGVEFNNKARSAYMNIGSCPDARAWLYDDDIFKLKGGDRSSMKIVSQNYPDLDKFAAKTSSVAFYHNGINPMEQKAAGGCRVCMYEHANYKGDYLCTDHRIANLDGHDSKFNNKTSSVQLIVDQCQPGDFIGVSLWQGANYQGKRLNLTKSSPNVGNEFNDRLSSVQFYQIDAKTAKATGLVK